MVWMNNHHVGYLGQENAEEYFEVINLIFESGYLPKTTGSLWGVKRQSHSGYQKMKNHLYARVGLADKDSLTPKNEPPNHPYSLLPHGNAIQVTKESDYLAELTEHLHGPDSYSVGTLHVGSRKLKNGNIREFIIVKIDGDQIGELTPGMSEKVLPALRHLEDLELGAACWARVRGSALAIEVTVYIARAHEIPDDWFKKLPITIPQLKSVNTKNSGLEQDPLDQRSIDFKTNKVREENWDF